MTDRAEELPKHHRATQSEKLVITASSLGTVFEWYDFYLYGLLAAIISAQFFSGVNETTGFIFALAAGAGSAAGPLDCAAEPTQTGYYFTADPVSANTGRRGFATSQHGTIWQDSTGVAPTEPFTPGPTVAPLDTQ